MDPLATSFTGLVGCRLPVQLAVMGGGVGTPALAAAVSAAGGLGMLSTSHPQPLGEQLREVRARTDAPVGVGFFAFDLPNRIAELELAAQETRVVDVFWGDPEPAAVERVHAGGALAFWQVGSREAAVRAVDAGCDVVVAQGVEAGGHVHGTTPLRRLLDEVLAAVEVPVVAAGGISTGSALAAVLDAGAAGARVGTRFIATAESGAHPDYVAALLAATGADTLLTTEFAEGWPDAPHRVLRACRDAAAAADDVVGEADYGGARWPVPRWSVLPPTAYVSGRVEAMAMYAGEGVGDVTDVAPAADVLARLAGDAARLRANAAG